MALKLQIGDKQFPSKARALNEIGKYWKAWPLDLFIDADAPQFSFMKALVLNHPYAHEKFPTEIVRIGKGRNVLGQGEMQVILADDQRVSITWSKCVTRYCDSQTKLLTTAMRHSISEQVKAEKKRRPQICELCASTEELELDHYPLAFKDIKAKFLEYEPPVGLKFVQDEYGYDHFAPELSQFSEAWAQYHYVFASYRLLCAPCHRGKK